jgi:hypothetical protein
MFLVYTVIVMDASDHCGRNYNEIVESMYQSDSSIPLPIVRQEKELSSCQRILEITSSLVGL